MRWKVQKAALKRFLIHNFLEMNYLIAGKFPDGSGEAKLAPREVELTELSAWGASRKEIADKLFISEHTAENHFRNIFRKTGCKKLNQLSAWWFCVKYKIPFELSPAVRSAIATFLLCIFSFGEYFQINDEMRPRAIRRVKIELAKD